MANSARRPRRRDRQGLSPRLLRVCEQRLGSRVVATQFPGGRGRKSCRLILADGRRVIATRRASRRAELEAETLTALGRFNAPVPRVLAFDGELLLQQDMGGRRLSEALAEAGDDSELERLLERALSGLWAAQRAGSKAGLERRLAALGENREWLIGLLDRPAVLGHYLKLPAPQPRLGELFRRLTVVNPRFVKWDARPGNSVVDDGGAVSWIDWEHCGTRCRLDDLAWLLCDEFTPDRPALERRLLRRYLPLFADGNEMTTDQAAEYLNAFGVFHSCVRLGLILSYKNRGSGQWWDAAACLRGDKAGVTLEAALRLCRRGARWAGSSDLTKALAPWFDQVAARLNGT